MNSAPQSARVALVTGASRGIGRAVALALAASGAHVVALARTQGALEELDDAIRALRPDVETPATLVPCDLRDFPAIDRLGEALYQRWGRLDVLVGDAGVLGPLSPLHHVDPKQWDEVMASTSPRIGGLIRALDPLLRQSPAGRVGVRHLRGGEPRASCAPIGAPTPSPRRRSTRSRAPMPPRPSTPRRSASCWSIPARCAPACARARCPAKIRMTLRTPEELAPKIVALCSPEWRETGKLYDFPHDRVHELRAASAELRRISLALRPPARL